MFLAIAINARSPRSNEKEEREREKGNNSTFDLLSILTVGVPIR